MNHPLPARPNFIPTSISTPTVSNSSNAIAGPSKPSLPPSAPHLPSSITTSVKPSVTPIDPSKCSICSSPPKYTCPRCSRRTCCLDCSKAHKSQDDCSGIRDPTAFVPLNQYGQGVWSDDYKWLEEGRRKVTGWGENVKIEEINNNSSHNCKDRDRNGRDRTGRGGAGAVRMKRNLKSDGLKRELLKCNCHIEFMPMGMEKKKVNQSSWNPKTRQLHITVQLVIPSILLGSVQSKDPLKTINHPRVLFSSPNSSSLPTLSSLPPTPLDLSKIVFVLPFHSTPSRPAPEHNAGQRLFYPPLDPSKPLVDILGGTAWVEYPIIEVMDKEKWEEGSRNNEMVVVPLSQPLTRTRDSGWGKRKIDSIDQANTEIVGQSEEVILKKVKGAGEGLIGLGDYESAEEDDDGSDNEGDGLSGLSGDEEEGGDEISMDDPAGEVEEPEPSLEVLQAVGMALAADLGEA